MAYRAGDLEAAERELDAGLAMLGPPSSVSDALRITAATCLYNRGLVHEARGETVEAREAYVSSLALRPNATVERHLDALPSSDDSTLPGALTVDALASALRERACRDADAGGEAPVVEVLGQRADPSARWISVACAMLDDGVVHRLFAFPSSEGLATAEATTHWTGGRYYAISEVRRFEVEPVVALGTGETAAAWLRTGFVEETAFGHAYLEITPPEAVETSIECYATGEARTTQRALVLCHGTCRRLLLSRHEEGEDEIACSDFATGSGVDAPAPAWATSRESEAQSPDYELTLRLDASGAALTVASGTPPEALRALAGAPLSLEALFAAMEPLEPFTDLRD